MSVELIGVPIIVMIILFLVRRGRRLGESRPESSERARTVERKQVLRTAVTRECPDCGQSMEEGYVIGPRGIYWNKNIPLDSFVTRGLSFVPSEPLGIFSLLPGPIRTQFFKAYRCHRCGIVLIDFRDQPSGP